MPKEDRKNSPLHSEFQAARIAARTPIAQAKQEGWEQFVSYIRPESTSKQLWDKIHKLSNSKAKQTFKLKINNQLTDDPSLISEYLANHFSQTSSSSNYSEQFIVSKSFRESSPLCFDPDNSPDYNHEFSYEELEWALHRVHGSSAGPDDVGYPLLKNLHLIGESILLTLFNNIWDQGVIPSSWKEGLIIAIPKPNKNKKMPIVSDQ
jgi:hypothetical protein